MIHGRDPRLPRWKRAIDVVGSLLLLLVGAPLLAVLWAVIRIWMGRPVVFRQVRPGLEERPFVVLKLRSMDFGRQVNGDLASDGERTTRLGRFLRATSLDELPQLINVLRGEMSFVGPRPLLPEYLPFYSPRERARHAVRPGITGLAQVLGRNDLSWDDRLELDVQYVERLSLSLDAWILLRTLASVFGAKGLAIDSSKVEGNLANLRGGSLRRGSRVADEGVDALRREPPGTIERGMAQDVTTPSGPGRAGEQ